MTFLAPLMALGGLAAIPVVLLYLVRQIPARRAVPTLLFWSEIHGRVHESVRWRKLRRWLSLLLQLFFVALVVLALCRPEGASRDRASIVFVVDNSLSLSAGGRMEEARARARIMIEQLPAGSPAALLSTAPLPRVVSPWTTDHRALVHTLAEITPAPVAAAPGPALTLARQIAASANATISLVTDGIGDGSEIDRNGILVAQVGSPLGNSGITRFAARRSPAAPDDVLLMATVESSSSLQAASPARVILERAGQVIDARAVPPGSHWTHEWTFPIAGPAEFSLRLEPPDAFPSDNRASLEIPALGRTAVLLVSEPNPFWEAALGALPGAEVTRIWPPETLRYGDPSKVAVFCGAVPVEDFQSAGLLLVDPEQPGFLGLPHGSLENPVVTDVASDDPLLRFTRLDRITVGRATKWDPAEGAARLAASGSHPLIFGRWDHSPRWMVLAFDPVASDWVLRASFPVFLANLLDATRGETGNPVIAAGPNPAVTTRLDNRADENPADDPTPSGSVLPAWPLWWWLLVAALCWLFVEWVLYHRRITE